MSEAHAQSHDAHDDHGHHVNYLLIFGALCVFTAISWALDVAGIKGKRVAGMNGTVLLITGVMIVSCCKAFCVMAFFMHIKFEGKWIYLMLVPTAILAIGLPIALMPDIGLTYYPKDTMQTDEYMRTHPPEEAGTAPHSEGDHPKGDHGSH